MRCRVLFSTVALAIAIAGCTSKQQAPAAAVNAPSGGPAVAVVADVSGSAKAVRPRYAADFSKVVETLGGGEHLYTFGITANSTVSPLAFDMSFQTSAGGNDYTRKVELKRLQRSAAEKFSAFLEADQPHRNGSAIVDSIRHAASVLGRTPAGQQRILVVLSDMIEQSERHDFTDLDEAGAAALMERLKGAGHVPDLQGARVWVAGITDGDGSLPAARVEVIRRFWERFFAASGARLEWYGPSLVDFQPRT